LYDRVDSEARLRRVFDDLEHSGARPEAIVFTGDLADKGETIAYGKLRALVDPAVRRLGAQAIWVMGNHDDRAAFRTTLLGQAPSPRPSDRVHFTDGGRTRARAPSAPGHHRGRLAEAHRGWVAADLATPAAHGTILARHRPPLPCVLDLAVTVELREQG